METKIKWKEGEGYITATYDGSGNGSASVTSNVNEGVAREQYISVETTKGGQPKKKRILVKQAGAKESLITIIRLDQTIHYPATMITRIVDEGGIEAIRASSHRVLGKNTASGVMTICRLDDADSNKFYDGSTSNLTGSQGDVFMKLPKFYYKAEEYSTDIWDITFVYGKKPDNTYKEWDGNDLIGVYEAYRSGNKLYSRSGVASAGAVTQANFKAYARNRGVGFTIVKWKHHCIMAFLFYAMYNHMDSQGKIGRGTNSYSKATGQTDSLGMEDTVAGGNGDSQSINFWGLENWWGNKSERIDNVVFNPDEVNGVWRITEDDGSTRDVQGARFAGYLGKTYIDEHLDLVPTGNVTASTIGYCDYAQTANENTSRSATRSSDINGTYGGVSFINANSDLTSSVASSTGTRLVFRGEIVEADSVSDYKALSAVG